MKFKKNNLFVLLAAICLSFSTFSGCSESEVFSAVGEEAPTLQASGGCAEYEEGITDHTPPILGDIDWDIITLVSFTDLPAPTSPCECTLYEHCAFLGFPQYTEAGYAIGYRSQSAPLTTPITILTPNGPNGYLGFEPVAIQGNPHLNPAKLIFGLPVTNWHKVCDSTLNAEPFWLYLHYPDDMAEADWPDDPIAATSGICIVDIVGGGGTN